MPRQVVAALKSGLIADMLLQTAMCFCDKVESDLRKHMSCFRHLVDTGTCFARSQIGGMSTTWRRIPVAFSPERRLCPFASPDLDSSTNDDVAASPRNAAG